jgi:hypothetical protein
VSGPGAALGWGSAPTGGGRRLGFLSCPARAQGWVSLPPGEGARLGFTRALPGHKPGYTVAFAPWPARRRRVHAVACTTTTRARGGLHDDDACTRRLARRRHVHAVACTTTTRARGGLHDDDACTRRQAGCRALPRQQVVASGLPGASSAARGPSVQAISPSVQAIGKPGYTVVFAPWPAHRRCVHAAACTMTMRARGGMHDDDACTRRHARRRRVHVAACTTTTRARGGLHDDDATTRTCGGKRVVGRSLGSKWWQAGCRAPFRQSAPVQAIGPGVRKDGGV